jgi:hypothetical protein
MRSSDIDVQTSTLGIAVCVVDMPYWRRQEHLADIAWELDFPLGGAHSTVGDKVDYCTVCAGWVPKNLTDTYKLMIQYIISYLWHISPIEETSFNKIRNLLKQRNSKQYHEGERSRKTPFCIIKMSCGFAWPWCHWISSALLWYTKGVSAGHFSGLLLQTFVIFHG